MKMLKESRKRVHDGLERRETNGNGSTEDTREADL